MGEGNGDPLIARSRPVNVAKKEFCTFA